jgi:hypothetical protein
MRVSRALAWLCDNSFGAERDPSIASWGVACHYSSLPKVLFERNQALRGRCLGRQVVAQNCC